MTLDIESHDFNKFQLGPELPSHWPILEARHMIKGHTYRRRGGDRDHNCACLVGWTINVVGHHNFAEGRKRVDAAIVAAIHELVPDAPATPIPAFNDARAHSKELLARVWNRAGALLGYVEGNPEA